MTLLKLASTVSIPSSTRRLESHSWARPRGGSDCIGDRAVVWLPRLGAQLVADALKVADRS